MNQLPLDIARCMGDDGDGTVCPKRDQCVRYRDQRQGVRYVWVAHLCRDGRYEQRIPCKKTCHDQQV